jgi:hypothetical protein
MGARRAADRVPYTRSLLKVDECAKRAIKNVEAFFNIKVPLDVGGKIGKTWRDTH